MHPDPAAGRCPAVPTQGERLLLSAMRAWASLRLSGQRPHIPMARALAGQTSDRVTALFIAWIQAVEAERRRAIEIQCPQCGEASTDEQRLIVACGVAPVAFEIGEQLLAPMLRDTQAAMVIGRALNAALAADGLPLPARLTTTPNERPAQRPTLH